MSLLTKFEVNPIICLFANAQTAWPIRSQDTVGIKRSVTKSLSGLENISMNVSTKFEIDPLSVWKCTVTALDIRGQEMAGIQ